MAITIIITKRLEVEGLSYNISIMEEVLLFHSPLSL